MTKPKLTAALRKALERAGAWDSLPDDERTRAAKKRRLAKKAKEAGEQAGAPAATRKPAKKAATGKKVATGKPRTGAATPESDPKLHAYDRALTSEHTTLPDLTPMARGKWESLALARGLKRAPELHAFLDACRTLRELHLHDPKALRPAPEKCAVRRLSVSGSSVDDLTFLRGFPQLERLELSSRGVPRLKGLGDVVHVPRLRTLRANQHAASTLAPLSKLDKLREYDAESTKALKSLDGLQACRDLRHVNVNLAPISDLGPLAGASKLLALKARGCGITTLEPLFGAKKLETLFVERTKLKSIEGIAKGLPGLRLLWLHSTNVKDLSPLRGLKGLLELDLAGLPVEGFSVLGELRSLEHLDLYQTRFADLDLLESLPNLVSARLEKTKIKRNDPRVKRLNTALKKKHGAGAGLHFAMRGGGLVKLRGTQAAFLDRTEASREHAEQFLS